MTRHGFKEKDRVRHRTSRYLVGTVEKVYHSTVEVLWDGNPPYRSYPRASALECHTLESEDSCPYATPVPIEVKPEKIDYTADSFRSNPRGSSAWVKKDTTEALVKARDRLHQRISLTQRWPFCNHCGQNVGLHFTVEDGKMSVAWKCQVNR